MKALILNTRAAFFPRKEKKIEQTKNKNIYKKSLCDHTINSFKMQVSDLDIEAVEALLESSKQDEKVDSKGPSSRTTKDTDSENKDKVLEECCGSKEMASERERKKKSRKHRKKKKSSSHSSSRSSSRSRSSRSKRKHKKHSRSRSRSRSRKHEEKRLDSLSSSMKKNKIKNNIK